MEDGPHQIDELKALVRRSIAIAEDNNRILHSMRRASRLKSLFWFLLFLFSAGTSLWFYTTYVAPRIAEIQVLYGNAQNTAHQAQTISSQIADYFKSIASSTGIKPR